MPEIFLPPRAPEETGAGAYQVPVMAVMLFPRPEDEEKRLRWQAAAYAGSYVEWKRLGAPDSFLAGYHRWIAHLWTLRQAPKAEMKAGLRRAARAVLAGEVFRLLLVCASHHARHFKVEHVRALISHLNVGRKYGSSESLTTKAWPEFRPAGHLWAAHPMALDTANRADRSTDQEVLRQLALAEVFRRKAEELGILKSGEGWRAPERVELPGVEINIGPLHEEELGWLDEQFPA